MNDLAPYTVTDHERGYYKQFWGNGHWAGVEPNADEQARWNVIETLLRKHGPDRPIRILDVGCGRGWLTAKLCKFGPCEGLDPVSTSAMQAAMLFPEIAFHAVDSTTWASEHGAAYDLVTSSEVIEHVRDSEKPAFIRSLAALVVPGGSVLLTTPRGEVSGKWFVGERAQQPVEDWITASALDALAAAHGLRKVERRLLFVEGNRFESLPSKIAHHWRFERFRNKYPRNPFVRLLDHYASIYQIVLYRKFGGAPV